MARSAREKWPLAFELVEAGKVNGRVAECVGLAAQGLVGREIAERLGISKTTALSYLTDPLREKDAKRKARYEKPCADCGKTIKPNGVTTTITRCIDCERNKNAERNELLREMWEADEPTWHIAATLGMTETAVTSWVESRRHRHGEDISLRRLGGNARERRRRHREMIRLRKQGLDNAQIAEAVGMASAESVKAAFTGMRRKGWDVPPPNRIATVATEEEFIAAYGDGTRPPREVAAELGYASTSGVAERAKRLRAKGLIP